MAVLVLAPAGAASQDPAWEAPVSRLTLHEAVERALQVDEAVRSARLEVVAAGARLAAARAERRPEVSSVLAYTRTFLSPFAVGSNGPGAPTPALGDLPFGRRHAWVAALQLDHDLYTGGRGAAVVLTAQRRLEAARLALDEVEGELALSVTAAYLDAVVSEALVEIAEASLSRAGAQLALSLARFEAGEAAELEVLRAEVDRANLLAELDDGRRGRDRAARALKELVGLPVGAPVPLEMPPVPREGAEVGGLPPPEAAAALVARRAAVREAGALVGVRGAEERAAVAALRPFVALSANVGGQAFPEQPLPGAGSWRGDVSASVRLQVPLIDGGRARAGVVEARARLGQAEVELERRMASALLEYEEAWRETERAWSQVASRRAAMEPAARTLDLVERRYREGLALQIEVQEARLALQQAGTHLVRATGEYHLARARARRALGLPVFPEGPAPPGRPLAPAAGGAVPPPDRR